MNENDPGPSDAYNNLRQKAEAALRGEQVDVTGLSSVEIQKLVHELQVYQIELEMQNEALRQTQLQLAESRDQYANLYDFAPIGYLILSHKGLIVQTNLTCADMLGSTRDDLLKKPFSLFISQDHQDIYYQHCRQAIKTNMGQTCELKIITKEGTAFEAKLESIADAKGQLRTTLRDITERVQTTALLQASEQKYRRLVEALQEGIWVIDKNANTTFVNQPMADMLGYTAAEMQGRHLYSFMDKANIAAAQYNLARRQQGIVEQHDFEFLRKDGSSLFVELATAPFLDENGNYDGAVAGLIDITARRLMEKHLARLNDCFLSFGADPMANINKLTALCGELLGADCALYNRLHQGMLCSWGQWQTPPDYNPIDNPEGHICYDVINQAQDDVVIIRNLLETTYAKTDPNVIPFNLQTYVGKAIQFEGNAVGSLCVVFIHDFDPAAEDLQIMTFIGSAIATEEKRLQTGTALRESNKHLQTTLAELKETQAQMVQQERQAAVGQLAAGIAHDFNNLMSAILLHAELMLKTSALSPKDRRKIELIHQQGQRAADLTQQILDFSRKSVMHLETLDLCRFLQGLNRLFVRTLPENIDLSLSCQMNACPVKGDPTRLQQAILNLVVNARDAMPDGGELHIKLDQVRVQEGEKRPYPQLTPGVWARLSVIDNGTGIEKANLDHIFEPFFTTKAPLGSGLGLSQVYGIVKLHEGHVDVTTKINGGSAFFLYLPMLVSTRPSAGPEQVEGLSLGHKEPILIVEDNDIVRQSLVEAVAALNYRPFSVSNGREALTFCQSPENKVALIITDLIMPEMGGEKLINHLRQTVPDMKVIIMTGYPITEQTSDMLSTGTIGWLQKPTNLHDLSWELARVLAGKRPFTGSK